MKPFNQIYESVFEPELLREMEEIGVYKTLKDGERYVRRGEYMTGVPLVISGVLKIIREDHNGHLALDFITSGETCSLSLSNQNMNEQSVIHSIAEGDTELLVLPKIQLTEWLCTYPTWQNFVVNTYHKRMYRMLKVIDMLAFNNKEDLVFDFVKRRAAVLQTSILKENHQQIADDLYSSRVVISRILKNLEDQNKILLGRNKIEIV